MMWELTSMSHDGMFEISGLGEGKLLLFLNTRRKMWGQLYV